MNTACPHNHTSYAIWRAQTFNALLRPEKNHHLNLEFLRPSPHRLFHAQCRRDLKQTSSAGPIRNNEKHDRSQVGRPCGPQIKDEDNEAPAKAILLGERNGAGRRDDRKPAERLKHIVENFPAATADFESKATQILYKEDEQTRPKLRGYAGTYASDSQALYHLENVPVQPEKTSRAMKIEWTPFSEDGQQDMLALVSSLKEMVKPEDADIPFRATRLSEILPESPVVRKMKNSRLRKREPEPTELQKLQTNPWANMLASPLRHCPVTGVRLPRDLLVPWGFVKNPNDQQVYLVPNTLANMEQLKYFPKNKVAEDSVTENDEVTTSRNNVDSAVDSGVLESELQVQTDLVGTSSTTFNDRTTTTKLNERPAIPAKLQRIYMLPLLSLLSHLNGIFISKNSDGSLSRDTLRAKLNLVLPARWKASMSATITNFKAASKNSKQSTTADGGLATQQRPNLLGDTPLDPKLLKWQYDIDEKMLTLLRERVHVALQALVEQNRSKRARHQRRIVAMKLPENSVDVNGADEVQATIEGSASVQHPDMLPELPEENEKSADHTAIEDVGGRIFLYVGAPASFTTDKTVHVDFQKPPRLRNTPSREHSGRAGPPPLSDSPYIPHTITALNAIRIPGFSIRTLLGEEGETRFRALAATFEPFQPPPPPHQDPNSGNEVVFKARTSPVDTHSAGTDDSYVILIRAKAPGAHALITELWKLWRYVGGKRNAHFMKRDSTWGDGKSEDADASAVLDESEDSPEEDEKGDLKRKMYEGNGRGRWEAAGKHSKRSTAPPKRQGRD